MLMATAGCEAGEAPAGAPEAPSFDRTATSAAGMVVTGCPYATEAGVRILEAGGNAVGIPGTVAALTRALAEYGSLSLDAVVAPALAWAREGVLLTAGEAGRIAAAAPELDPTSELARIFLDPDGEAPPAGSLLVQTDLAAVLQALARGGAGVFYRGDIARRMAEDMDAHGGFVTEADLAGYRALDSEVGVGHFNGRQVWGTYLPASGVTVIEILQILDGVELADVDETVWSAAVAEALEAGFADRETAENMEDRAAVAWLTSDSLAERHAVAIADRLGTGKRTRVRSGRDGDPAPVAVARSVSPESSFTTHVSVVDTFGTAVALTQSLGPTLGARVVTPGLGFIYASTLGGYLSGGGPGYRPWSSQAPVLVAAEGRPEVVLGGAGARRIISAMVTTLDRVLRSGQDLEAALAAPRLHVTGGRVDVEEGWDVADGLSRLGYEVRERETSYFARLNAVAVLPDGSFRGAGEPRWTESAAGGPRR